MEDGQVNFLAWRVTYNAAALFDHKGHAKGMGFLEPDFAELPDGVRTPSYWGSMSPADYMRPVNDPQVASPCIHITASYTSAGPKKLFSQEVADAQARTDYKLAKLYALLQSDAKAPSKKTGRMKRGPKSRDSHGGITTCSSQPQSSSASVRQQKKQNKGSVPGGAATSWNTAQPHVPRESSSKAFPSSADLVNGRKSGSAAPDSKFGRTRVRTSDLQQRVIGLERLTRQRLDDTALLIFWSLPRVELESALNIAEERVRELNDICGNLSSLVMASCRKARQLGTRTVA